MIRSKKGKAARRKLFSYIIIFLLVGGLLLSVTAGFFDFLWGRKNLTYPTEENEFVLNLKKQASLLEESLRENPGDLEKQAALGSVYYELAMYYWSQGLEEGKIYTEKSQELLLPAAEGGLREPLVTLKIALLAAFIEKDDFLAEKYFRETLELQDDYPEAHFYFGLFLASQERGRGQNSLGECSTAGGRRFSFGPEARYLQVYAEKDSSKEKGESNPLGIIIHRAKP